MKTAQTQAAEIVKRAQDVAKAQASEIVERATAEAQAQATDIIGQARQLATAQAADIVRQADQATKAHVAEIVMRTEADTRRKTEAVARALAHKTAELARLEREYRRRLAEAAPIPRSKPQPKETPAVANNAAAKPTTPPRWNVDLEKDRQAIERAITDYYFVSNNWGEIHQIRNIRIHEIRGDQVEMTVGYLVASMSTAGWRGFAKRDRQGRFLLAERERLVRSPKDVGH